MKDKKESKQRYKLICFDVDGTIIEEITSIWNHFTKEFGCDMGKKELAAQNYMKNLITYDEWVDHDVRLWKDSAVTKENVLKVVRKLKIVPHSVETIKELKKKGLKVGILSDSLDIALEGLIPDYRELFDEIMINKIFFDEEGTISGWKATKYGMERKADGLKRMAENEGFRLEECIFVGDGHNDVKAAEIAGLSIAFNSDCEELRKVADVVIDKKDLNEVLKHID